ncbi:signal peptide peptidase SppA [Fusobacterium nucleatum]
MNFLKTVLAVIVGFFITLSIALLALIGIASTFAPKEETFVVKDNAILELNFTEPVYEYGSPMRIKDFDYEIAEENTLPAILRAIKYAQTDTHIKGIVLGSTQGIKGKTHLADIRRAVEDFKTSGKFVYAFSESASQYDYWLQSVADSVFVGTLGSVDVQGLSAEILYYKDLQEKTGVHMEVFRHGKYKSAVEPFLENTMSEANREQITSYLRSLWNSYAEAVSSSRGLSLSELDQVADSLWGRTPELALQHHLVDRIAFRDQFEESVRKASKCKEVNDLQWVPIEKYTEKVTLDRKKNLYKEIKNDKIAVIFCDGEIIEGQSTAGKVGHETIIKALRDAREDKRVKAIVLRVNSPGGSGLASELIHREIALTQKKKPVYASMGNVAASGGYYISCNATRIFADRQTLTGSIGVFGVVPNLSELAQRWGVHSQQVQTHSHALTYSLFEKTPEKTRQVITEGIESFYKKFVQRVADGRHMSWEEVDALAQGRVWTGQEALEKGLVDEIGSLRESIAYAAKEQKLSEGKYLPVAYPVIEVNFMDYMKQRFRASSQAELKMLLQEEIGKELYEQLQRTKNMIPASRAFLQARMPYEVSVK